MTKMNMQYVARRKITSISFFIALTALTFFHLTTIFLPSINLEFAFADAVDYFRTGNADLLEQYFRYQANTLAFPFAGYLLGILLPLDPLILLRLLSTFGLLMLGLSMRRIASFFGADFGLGFYFVLLLNPLIWTFAGRATADLFPAATAIYALSLTLRKDGNTASELSAGILFGVAGILKYHVLGLSVVLFFASCPLLGFRIAARKTALVTFVGLSIVAAFLIFNHLKFGFVLTPERYQEIHHLSFRNYFGNLIGYFGFIILILTPFVFIVPKFQNALIESWKIALSAAAAAFFFGFMFVVDSGELNLGPLDHWISHSIRFGLLSLFVLTGLVALLLQLKQDPVFRRRKTLLLLGLFIVLLVFSSTRPAQRYLIAFFPFFLMLLPPTVFTRKRIVLPTLALLVLANTFIAYSQWSTGMAAQRMVYFLIEARKIEATDPGDIGGHVGNLFRGSDPKKASFRVVSGRVSDAIFMSESPFSFARKTYSLVPISSGSEMEGHPTEKK